jgi:hypothetical protein
VFVGIAGSGMRFRSPSAVCDSGSFLLERPLRIGMAVVCGLPVVAAVAAVAVVAGCCASCAVNGWVLVSTGLLQDHTGCGILYNG